MRAKIHTLVFLGFTAVVATALSGCVVDNRTNPPPNSCIDQRYATVAWRIVKDANNVELSCEQANASTVVLYFGSDTYSFPCGDYNGFTDAGYSPGSYTTSMQLLSSSGTVLSDTAYPSGPSSFPIYSCQPDDIPTVTFGVL